MDQLKSSKEVAHANSVIDMPRRKISLEFWVGLFTLVGVAATGYLAVGLGGMEIMGSDKYPIVARFDNISGLKNGASVEIAGVPIGNVTSIVLKNYKANVTLNILKSIQIAEDDILSIRTKGIIGDRYVKVSRGASDKFIAENGITDETESVIDIEDIIGKIVHSFSGDDEEDKAKDKDKAQDKE